MRDKPSLNRNIRSAPLYLFGKVQVYFPFGEFNSWILIILIVMSFTFIGNFIKKKKKKKAETGYLHLLITGYNNNVMSCNDIALISFFCYFSSLSMRLLVFHLECHCILL